MGNLSIETEVVRSGQKPDKLSGAIPTPIYQTANYAFDGIEKNKGYEYSRANHPTKEILERNLTVLEEGVGTVAFGSGLAAELALFHTLKAKDHIIFCEDVYGGTYRLLNQILNKFGLRSDFIDMANPDAIRRFINDSTKMIFIETPTNPLLKLVDIEAVGEIAKEYNIHYVVDNTFITPYFQKPIKLGAQTVVHSLTKYLAGHNDVTGGSITSIDKELIEELKFILKSTGGMLAPWESWLTIRGIKTLAVRMKKHEENAIKIAGFLEGHEKVKKVHFPGLKSNPQSELAKKQMTGFGGMISFELEADPKAFNKFVKSLEVWIFAESLGGVESLVSHPPTMSHSSLPRDLRIKKGIPDGLFRLSCGIENADDLIQDLEQAFKKI